MMPLTDRARIEPGSILEGRYRVDGVLGQGGYGTVLRATQLTSGHAVAIKVLHQDLLAEGHVLERFLREARLSQELEHPNTIRLLDVGRLEQGVPFIVFELLDGQSLEDALQRSGPMPAQRAARIAAQVLKSLMEAHGRTIVHRDLKPANIFLCDFEGQPDFVKVLDFGISKALDGSSRGIPTLTAVGSFFGTPSYVSPECIRSEPATPRSDLYSLGLVVAEMLTGSVVVRGPSPVAICAVHLDDEPLPLPPALLASPLGEVIRRAVEKDPGRRFGSAGEMLEALEQSMRQPGGRPAAAPVVDALGPTLDASIGVAPTLAAPPGPVTGPVAPQPPPPRARPGTLALVFLGVVIAAILGGAATAVLILHVKDRGERPAAAVEENPSSPRLSTLTPELIRQRLLMAGCSIVSEEDRNVNQFVSFTVQIGQSIGSVDLQQHPSEAGAEYHAAQYSTAERIVDQDGRTLLVVYALDRGARAELRRIVLGLGSPTGSTP